MARLFYRRAEFDRSKIDKEKRTVPLLFSTETPVDRGGYDEILDHGAVDLNRLQNSAALLRNHNPDEQIGVVESAHVDGNKGRAVVRFGKSALAEQEFQDVLDGIRTKVSVGYDRTRAISRTKSDDGRDVIRFAWTPYELSMVSIEADTNTGVGRSENPPNAPDPFQDPMKRSALLLDPATGGAAGGGGTQTATPPAPANVSEITNKIRAEEMKRAKEINAGAEVLGKQFPEAVQKFRDLADKAISEGHTVDQFNADLLAAIPGIRKAEVNRAGTTIGLNERDKKRYSILRGVQKTMERLEGHGNGLDGLELECHQEMVKRCQGLAYKGFLVPADIEIDGGSARRGYRMAMKMARDLNVTTAGQGGDFVQTTILTSIIEVLRNRMVTDRLGVQSLSGLQGNIAIPRQTGVATAFSLAEAALLTLSTQAINQVSLTPKRVGATNQYTKQLLLQSSVDVENFIRDDLMKVLAIKIDALILNGQGVASEPTGIINTTGIGTVTFGATATWAKVLAFETALALANADIDGLAYCTSPDVRGAWKNIAKVGTFPSFLWENNTWVNVSAPDYGVGTSNDGLVNGYRAAATNQVTNSRVFFGNWEDAILAMWGGYDVVVNPYTLDQQAEVRITVNTFIDVAIRHAASFCVSTDSGNQ